MKMHIFLVMIMFHGKKENADNIYFECFRNTLKEENCEIHITTAAAIVLTFYLANNPIYLKVCIIKNSHCFKSHALSVTEIVTTGCPVSKINGNTNINANDSYFNWILHAPKMDDKHLSVPLGDSQDYHN